uniref:Putative nucleic-acid-binding protein from transposon x-element n=1 Tax=Lutzomyia longipalpis TaxID=7200 RepID=A0A1B0GH17_LUTLO
MKIQVKSIDAYRALLKALKEHNTDMHSYQPKSDRTFRVILRNIHHSTKPEEIIKALQELGHCAKNVHNIKDKNRRSLPMFFVDLQTDPKNREIYDINRLLGYVVKFDPPRPRKEIVQCARCQRLGHTKAFCHRPPRCIKCTGAHLTKDCERKVRDDNVKCVNCGGNHPANYRGCQVHTQLWEKKYPALRQRVRRENHLQTQENHVELPNHNQQQQQTTRGTYADVTRGASQRSTQENNSNSNDNGSQNTAQQSDINEIKEILKTVALQMSTLMSLMTQVLDSEITVPHSIASQEDLDGVVARATQAIQTAAWMATPAVERGSVCNKVPASVREKVLEKRSLRKRWKQTRHPSDKAKFNKAAKELSELLRHLRDTSINKYLSGLSPTAATDYSLWKATKNCNRPQLSNPPIRGRDGEWAKSDGEKANAFAQHLQQVFQPWPVAESTAE